MRADESLNRVPSHKSVGLLADTSDGGTCLVLRLERQYNLGVIFTEGPDGTFLSEVDVRLRRHDKVLAAIQATGPRCLLKLPPDYRVEATCKERTQYVIMEAGSMGTGIRW